MKRAIVLLSGGQDSTTCLYWARENGFEPLALSFFYGQRHAIELEAAREIAECAGVERVELDVSALGQIRGSALIESAERIESAGGFIDHEMPEGLPTSFVPGRNALFLVLAASVAVQRGAKDLVTGVCQTDFSGYPDCRREFIDSMERSLTLAMPSSCGPFVIHTPLMWMTKADSVRLARSLCGCWKALAHTVTCYNGQRPGCGMCPACQLRARGFVEAGEADPSS